MILAPQAAIDRRATLSDNPLVHAEVAYMFRHALMREGAYQMQLPSDRARLHELALAVLEKWLRQKNDPALANSLALELADHARAAQLGRARRGLAKKEVAYLRQAIAVAIKQCHFETAALAHVRIAELGFIPPATRFEHCVSAASLSHELGSCPVTIRAASQATELAKELGNGAAQGRALCLEAKLAISQGRSVEGEDMARRGLALIRAAGARRFEAGAINDLANALFQQARHAEAYSLFMQSLAIHKERNSVKNIAAMSANVALALRRLGRLEEAETHYRQSLEIYRRLSDANAVNYSLAALASFLHHGRKESEAAERMFLEAIAGQRAAGHLADLGVTLCHYANVLLDANRFEEAEPVLLESLALTRERPNLRFEATVLGQLGELHEKTGKPAEAEQHYRQAIEIVCRTHDARLEGIAKASLGLLLRRIGRREEAEALLDGARQSLEAVDAQLELRKLKAMVDAAS